MIVHWTPADGAHIQTRSRRYAGAVDIEIAWADEAAADARGVVVDPDTRSRTGAAIRIIGYSPTAGFLITIIADRIGDELWGINAWKTTGGDRRAYYERAQGR